MNTKTQSNNDKPSESSNLDSMQFEDVLERLLKVKPVANKDLVKGKREAKQTRKPETRNG